MGPSGDDPAGDGRGMTGREKLVLGVVSLAMLAALVAAAVGVGLLGSRFIGDLDLRSPERGEPGSSGVEDGSGRVVGAGMPASRTDMDDRETYLRVTGAGGLIFLGRVDDSGTPEEGIKFETTVPAEYELEVDRDGLVQGYFADTGSFFSGIEDPWLKAEIVHEGRVVSEAETRMQGGRLYVGWSPDAPPAPRDREGTVTVRVTGEEGTRFDGTLGRGSRDDLGRDAEEGAGIPKRYGIRSVEGTVPAEYEVPLDLGSEMALANFTKDYANEADGELRVELIHAGEIVERAGTGEQNDPLGTTWPAPKR